MELRRFFIISVLLFAGCVPPRLNTTIGDLGKINLDKDFGVVFGSVQIKVEGEPYKKLIIHSLHDTNWHLTIENLYDSNLVYSIEGCANGKEFPFVGKLPVGSYRFVDMERTGWVAGQRPVKGFIQTYFDVVGGESAYIGRLVITLPNSQSNPMFLGTGVAVEDTQAAAIQLFDSNYGDIFAKSAKALMIERYLWERKKKVKEW